MLEDPNCPSCTSHDWEVLRRRSFERDTQFDTWGRRIRHRVLFEIWQPDASQIDVEIVLCRTCGFLTFRPRPTAADIDAKYRFFDRLAKKRMAKDPVARQSKPLGPIDVARSQELLAALTPFVAGAEPRVLDFGGRSGALMTKLVESDWRCSVIDYESTTLPGIERLGNTLQDIPPARDFDVIVASHVLEHVADPIGVLRDLARLLAPDGILFVETPLEIVGRVPELPDLVTHINFFTEATLAAAFQRIGLEPLAHAHEPSMFETGRVGIGTRVIGRRARSTTLPGDRSAVQQVRALLTAPPVVVGGEGTDLTPLLDPTAATDDPDPAS